MPTLLSSPLQGFTDFRFRNAFHKYFGGIDTYFAPYIRLNGKMEIKPNYQRDLSVKNNAGMPLIPQVMTNDPDEFLFVVKYVQSLGYKELNWNLGCPYPMVTNRGMGSGLICQPQRIDAVLKKAHEESDIVVSMKMRMGYEHNREIFDVYPILEKYPIKNIAIHARIGKQLYKGGVDLEGFEACLKAAPHKVYYNGDITTVEGFRDLQNMFPSIDHWMIGRGILSDPFLAQMIKNNSTNYPSNRFEVLSQYHDTMLEAFQEALSGDKHVIMKMHSYWEYLAQPFENASKIIKKVKKCKVLTQYEDVVAAIWEDLQEVQTTI